MNNRKCMIISGTLRTREKIALAVKARQLTYYMPVNNHDLYGFLYDNYIDFLIIDVENWYTSSFDLPGFEIADIVRNDLKLRRKPIIFVSDNEESKLLAYEKFNCIDYILKPVDFQPLMDGIEKALIFSENVDKKNIYYIKMDNIYTSVNIEDVSYIDICGRNVSFHMLNNEVIGKQNGKLKDIEGVVKKHGFIQVRRNTLVNTHYIKHIDLTNRMITMSNKEAIDIGIAYRNNIESYMRRHEMFDDMLQIDVSKLL